MHLLENAPNTRIPWNKGKLVGQKPPLKLREIWAIRIRLQLAHRTRDLALFNMAIDSKLRACDLVRLRVRDVAQGGQVARRAIILQRKTQRPVRFEIADQAREAVQRWLREANLKSSQYLFPSRTRRSSHITTRQYARRLHRWILYIGLNPMDYGTHSLRRTKATLIYRRTKNLRAVQLLLGHAKLESTVRYLGIEVEDALEMAERTDV
jgi:integrase